MPTFPSFLSICLAALTFVTKDGGWVCKYVDLCFGFLKHGHKNNPKRWNKQALLCSVIESCMAQNYGEVPISAVFKCLQRAGAPCFSLSDH